MTRKKIYILFIIVLVAVWSYFIYNFGAEHLVQVLGVTNGYLLAFFVTLFGGSSTLTSLSYIATITTLALGGLDPLVLALIGGAGLFMGDLIYYYIGFRGREVFVETDIIKTITKYADKLPHWAAIVIMYLYFSTPFPNDFLIVLLGLSRFSFRQILIPLVLGDMTFIFIVSYFVTKF